MRGQERACALTRRLLDWYDQNRRALPWRESAGPYEIWVSEIMAQQTRITALLPYYARFIARFPTVRALAEADEADVLKAWEGLGYYSRARNLHRAARLVMAQHGGQIPRERAALLALPGVGEYTAGAVLSIAFGVCEPAVDGNVLRVYARLENDARDVLSPPVRRVAAEFVRALMPPERAGCFTQALMELGALVCTPKSPSCAACPLAGLCRACALGVQQALPSRAARPPKRTVEVTVLVVRDPLGRVLMRERDERLLGGLWEYVLLYERLSDDGACERLRALGLTARAIRPLCAHTHVFTHVIWRMTGFACDVDQAAAPPGYGFLSAAQRRSCAMAAALRPYIDEAERL